MALKIWLPLDGDLRNLGASDVEVVNNGVTIDNAGKIGKCYSFNGSNNYLLGSPAQLSNDSSEWSFCCWFKPNNSHQGTLFCNRTTINSTGIMVLYYGSTFLIDDGGRWQPSSSGVQINQWNHIAVTVKRNEKKCLYLNGVLINSTTTTSTPTIANATHFTIGGSQGSNTSATGNWFNGYINDVRIYDHYLSAAEVHEISQGLVLHYKLDNNGMGNPNLALNSKTFNNWTVGSGWQKIIENNDTIYHYERTSATSPNWYRLIPPLQLNPENYLDGITVSFDFKCDDVSAIDHLCLCALQVYRSDGVRVGWREPSWDITSVESNKWIRLSRHFTYAELKTNNNSSYPNAEIAYTTISFQLCKNGSIYIKNVKIENGSKATPYFTAPEDLGIDTTIIKDSSGYEHNGKINDTTLKFVQDSARYALCMMNSQSNNSNTYPFYGECNIPESSEITFTWWMKPTSLGMQTSGIFSTSNLTSPTDYNTTAANMRDSHFDCCNTEGTCVRLNVAGFITLNEWHHYALTYNGTNLSFYRDGELKRTTAQTGSLKAFKYIFPFYSRAGGVSRTTSGYLSDFRIYCTPLLDNDIKMLYNVGMRVDNLSGIHSFELEENSSNSKIFKTGILQSSQMGEHLFSQHLKYDTNVYIELDGSAWVRIYHHNNPETGVFSSTDDFINGVYLDENRWFNVNVCNYLNKWEFIVKGKFTTTSDEWKIRWIQQVNPMIATYEEVAAENTTTITNSGGVTYNNKPWGGIYAKKGSAYITTNNGTQGNWWGAIGAYSFHQNGIPGWGPSGGVLVTTTGFNDLYVRIDNIEVLNPNNASIRKNQTVATEFIEI